MNNPLDVALQHVSETKHLLNSLITSSESFDYPKAKLALVALTKKACELERLRAQWLAEAGQTIPTNVVMLRHSPVVRSPAHSS